MDILLCKKNFHHLEFPPSLTFPHTLILRQNANPLWGPWSLRWRPDDSVHSVQSGLSRKIPSSDRAFTLAFRRKSLWSKARFVVIYFKKVKIQGMLTNICQFCLMWYSHGKSINSSLLNKKKKKKNFPKWCIVGLTLHNYQPLIPDIYILLEWWNEKLIAAVDIFIFKPGAKCWLVRFRSTRSHSVGVAKMWSTKMLKGTIKTKEREKKKKENLPRQSTLCSPGVSQFMLHPPSEPITNLSSVKCPRNKCFSLTLRVSCSVIDPETLHTL